MKNKFSFSVLLFISAVVIFIDFSRTPEGLLSWDQFGYYLYLPLTFIYHDLGIKDFSVIDALIHKYQPITDFYQGIQLQDGSYVLRYTAGLSVLYSPAFFAGHLGAWLFGYPMDGFSAPYQYAILGWSIFFLIVGLQHLRLILLHYFSDKLSAFLLLVIFFGTNFLVMSGHDGILLVNTYLFTLFSIMLWHTIKWHERHSFRSAIIIGLTLGLSILTRPVDLIFVMVPVLWGIKNIRGFGQKMISLFTIYKWHTILMILILLCISGLQLLYWKNRTGEFFYDSYGANAGEGFDFATPYTLKFLFSYRKGWLLYTPVMVFSLAGFFVLYKKKREIFFSTVFFFCVFLFLVSSWTYWWYATCYSQRTMLEIYSLLAIPLGFFVEWSSDKKQIVPAIMILLTGLNLFQSWQYKKGILDGERMSEEYYKAIFLKTEKPENAEDVMLVNRDENSFLDETKHTKKELLNANFVKEAKAVQRISLKDTIMNFFQPA